MHSLTAVSLFLAVSTAFVIPRTDNNSQLKRDYDPLAVSSNAISLTRRSSKSAFRSKALSSGAGGFVPLINLDRHEFIAEITLGSQNLLVQVDTGSSEMLIAGEGFQCLDSNSSLVSISDCDFGPLYEPSSTFKQIPNENFLTSFGDNTNGVGIVGTEAVTFGGIEVKQQIAVLKAGFLNNLGHGVSGLVGLAFPALTGTYQGTNATLDDQTNKIIHDPLFFTMFKQGKAAPVFTLTLEPTTTGSALTLGGIPKEWANATFATAPLVKDPALNTFNFYNIRADGFKINGKTLDKSSAVVTVDSGSSMTALPNKTVSALAAAYHPAARFNETTGDYQVRCNAKAPDFAVVIGGTSFAIKPEDLIVDNGDGSCSSGITAAPSEDSIILGDTFMRSVVSVFDIGNAQMHFTSTAN